MNREEIAQTLSQSLDDRNLSRGERKALGELIAQEPDVSLWRPLAFEAAIEAIGHPDARSVLEWLDDLLRLLPSPASSEGGTAQNPVSEVYFSPGDACTSAIIRQLRSARRQVELCVFTITDDRITDAILEAHDRGVVVRLITDDEKSGDLGSDIDRLRKAGIATRIDRTEAHMHHKFALIDGARLLNGSFNWTRAAARENEENLMVLSDKGLIAQFSRQFEAMWLFLE